MNTEIVNNHIKNKLFLMGSNMRDQNTWEFLIQNLCGNNFTVCISNKLECSCNKGIVCKHIMFTVSKIINCSVINESDGNIKIFLFKFNLKTDKFNNDINPRYINDKINNDNKINDATNKECPICYELFPDEVKLQCTQCTRCKYAFHKECLKQWMRKGTACNCPICRNINFRNLL